MAVRLPDIEIEPPGNGAPLDGLFSDGGGETGALLRTLDWRAMPLGPIRHWPQSLRSAVSLCVSSRFPIAIYWGTEFVMLYNDALLPMVGANKHPRSFGRPAFEVLPEVRELLEPLLKRVLAGGDPVWSEDMMLPLLRQEAPEESYFTFTYSAIRLESGAVGGVFCAVIETTEKVIEGRRLRLLSALADVAPAKTPAEICAFAAAKMACDPGDIPFALHYLLDESSRTATLVGAANMEPGTALSPASIAFGEASPWPFDTLDQPRFIALDAVLPGVRGAAILAIERAGGGAPLGFMVVGLSAQLRKTASYDVFHRLLAASVSRLVSNAAAYEAQARTTRELERALKRAEASEARFHAFLMQAPVPICILEGSEYRFTLTNPMYQRLVGRSDLVGKSVAEARSRSWLDSRSSSCSLGSTRRGRRTAATSSRSGSNGVRLAKWRTASSPSSTSRFAISTARFEASSCSRST